MIKRETAKDGSVKLTFVQQYEEGKPAVFVLGDFNNWEPSATKLVKRANGTASASITVSAGQKVRFRYRNADGLWFNDEAADAYEAGDAGEQDSVVVA